MAARRPTKSAAAGADSRAVAGSKKGAGGVARGVNRVRGVRRGRVPGAGDRLRSELGRDGDSYSVSLLIEQAARNADRLDVINDLLAGDSKAWFEVEIAGAVAEVRVTNLVVEERQRSAALQKILVDIARMRGDGVKGQAPAGSRAKKSANPITRIQQGRRA